MRRFLETLFRRKEIVLVPLIVTPLVALGVLALNGAPAEVSTTLWVERSPYLEASGETSSDAQSNEIEAQALGDWLTTASFRTEVLERSGVAPLVRSGDWPRLNGAQRFTRAIGLDSVPLVSSGLRAIGLAGPATTDAAMGEASQHLRTGVEVSTEGNNLLEVSYASGASSVSVAIVEAVIATYRERTVERRTAAAEEATAFQTQQVEGQRGRVQEANAALNAFLAENPAPRSGDAEAEAEALRRAYELEQSVYEDAVLRLGELRMEGQASVAQGGLGFQVIDPASAPGSSGVAFGLVGMMLFLGLVVGAGLGLAGIAVISWTDKTVRGPQDLQGLAGLSSLGTVPAAGPQSPHAAWLLARDAWSH
ncbi:MAG: hypothetical protein WD533_08990 [Dehalococcoidia bacterium]